MKKFWVQLRISGESAGTFKILLFLQNLTKLRNYWLFNNLRTKLLTKLQALLRNYWLINNLAYEKTNANIDWLDFVSMYLLDLALNVQQYQGNLWTMKPRSFTSGFRPQSWNKFPTRQSIETCVRAHWSCRFWLTGLSCPTDWMQKQMNWMIFEKTCYQLDNKPCAYRYS